MSGKAGEMVVMRAYHLRNGAPWHGARLLVDRLWPRGIAKADLPIEDWLKDVTPSPALRKWFGHKPERWEEFSERYRAELRQAPQVLEPALLWCRRGPVTLITATHDLTRTHVLVLRDELAAWLATEKAPQ